MTSNQKHLPVLVFEIELILSQKQERAMKSSKKQRATNGSTPQKPKLATKSYKEHFSSHVNSFVPTLGLWKMVDIKSNKKPERARTGNAKQHKAGKSNKEQQKAETDRSWKNQKGQ